MTSFRRTDSYRTKVDRASIALHGDEIPHYVKKYSSTVSEATNTFQVIFCQLLLQCFDTVGEAERASGL